MCVHAVIISVNAFTHTHTLSHPWTYKQTNESMRANEMKWYEPVYSILCVGLNFSSQCVYVALDSLSFKSIKCYNFILLQRQPVESWKLIQFLFSHHTFWSFYSFYSSHKWMFCCCCWCCSLQGLRRMLYTRKYSL